jgi:hypothetical protein
MRVRAEERLERVTHLSRDFSGIALLGEKQ